MSKLKAWFNRPRRLIATMFIQVWFWPQVLFSNLPLNIGFPLFITAFACIIYNLISAINSFDRGEHLE